MTEIELKIELTAPARGALLASDMFQQPSDMVHQHDVYFDTADHRLRKAGFSLRIRASGNGFKQTIKLVPSTTSDIYARGEWERTLANARPIIDLSTPLAQALNVTAADLIQQFDVRVERQRWLVTQEDSDIEIALDSGTISAGVRHTNLSEMELELKDGKAEALFSLLQRLAQTASFKIGVTSKSERGYNLLEALQAEVKAEPMALDRSMTVAASLQTIAAACFRQFRLNEDILLQSPSPEALHGARVALRRLRSALKAYRPVLRTDEISDLDDGLRWIATVLGSARDLDVLMAKAHGTGSYEVLNDAREAAYDDVMEALKSERASILFVDFNRWLRCGAYLGQADPSDDAEVTLPEFAADVLTRFSKKLRKHGRSLTKMDDGSRHRARKDAKRLRYATEFFGSLFPARKGSGRQQQFVKALEKLQDKMGLVNDLASTDAILKELGLSSGGISGPVAGDAAREKLVEEAERLLDKLLKLKKFWR